MRLLSFHTSVPHICHVFPHICHVWKGKGLSTHLCGKTDVWKDSVLKDRVLKDRCLQRHMCAKTSVLKDICVQRHLCAKTDVCKDICVARPFCLSFCLSTQDVLKDLVERERSFNTSVWTSVWKDICVDRPFPFHTRGKGLSTHAHMTCAHDMHTWDVRKESLPHAFISLTCGCTRILFWMRRILFCVSRSEENVFPHVCATHSLLNEAALFPHISSEWDAFSSKWDAFSSECLMPHVCVSLNETHSLLNVSFRRLSTRLCHAFSSEWDCSLSTHLHWMRLLSFHTSVPASCIHIFDMVVCDMSCSYVTHYSFILIGCVWHVLLICHTWFIHIFDMIVCDKSCSYLWHDSFILIDCVWHVFLISLMTRLPHMS